MVRPPSNRTRAPWSGKGSGRRPGPSRPGSERQATPGAALATLLREIDGQEFGAYRRLLGRAAVGEFAVVVDRVPPDPFAGPARIRLVCERAKANVPPGLLGDRTRLIGAEDFLARAAHAALAARSERAENAPPGSGRLFLEPIGPAMIERGCCRITGDEIELRLFLDLPALGRRVRGRRAADILLGDLPTLATSTLLFSQRRAEEALRFADLAEDHAAIQAELPRRGLIAFVADGSLLVREGGDDGGPRHDGREVPFQTPAALAVTLDLPNGGPLRGMGIPAGVTLVVGGGFHGKSTLLEAVAAGIHPHPPGDGRERVATSPSAVTIRAEVGRSIRRLDVSSFLGGLPSGARSADFSTDRASGIASQAAAVAEALEAGADLLLVDEDTSAISFMIRDGRMQRLVPRPGEPIVPFIDRARDLYESLGVSTILVTGGAGDYFESADTVIVMSAHLPEDATARAREIVESTRSIRRREAIPPLRRPAPREPFLDREGRGWPPRTGVKGTRGVRIGEETVDLAALEQLTEAAQTRALARLLRAAADRMAPGKGVRELVSELDSWIDAEGIDALDPPAAHDLARPRRLEIAAAINRWRSVAFRRPDL